MRDAESSFPALVRKWAERDGGRPALTFGTTTWSFAELRDRFESLATGLSRSGVRRGDRVLYAGLNHPSLVLTMLASMDSGAVFAPVNPRLASVERDCAADDLRPSVAVVDDEFRGDFAGAAPVLVSADGDGTDSVAGLVARHGAELRHPVRSTDLGLILHTSGTTGRPRGVMYSHGMILANGVDLIRLLGVRRDEVGLVMTPMFHTAGLITCPAYLWSCGGHVIVLPRMDGPAVLEAIGVHRVTRIDTVTAALGVLVRTPGFSEADITCVRSLLVGGAPIPVEHVMPFRAAGADIFMAAGMTECTVAAALPPWRLDSKPTSVGTPLSLVESCIKASDSGTTIDTAGVTGEWCIRGPAVTSGYWNDPAATAAAVDAEGWFHTGDLARLDTDGDLFLVGRLKDVIKTGGESVAAAEVEAVIARHPEVSVTAVVGMPHDRWGETIVAVVRTTADGDLTLEGLREFCGPHLARFKLPTRLVLVEDLPMTASGKVAKGVLRERLGHDPEAG